MSASSARAAIWRRRWVALAVLIVVLAAVAGWLQLAHRTYTASATIAATPPAALLQSTGNYDNLETTLAQIANSQSVLQDVQAQLTVKRTLNQLRNEVQAARVTGTVLIHITVTDGDPRGAAEIANATAKVLPRHDPSGGVFVFTQIDRARVPTTYSSPNTKIIVLAGAALALLLALATALLYDGLAGTVDTVDQLRPSTGEDVLTVLPRPNDVAALPAADGSLAAAAAFRSLRVAIEFASQDEPIGAIVVTGLSPSRDLAGWVACNIAAALAQGHHSVLLIDGDPGPAVAHPALASDDSAGLYGVLRDDVSLDDAVRAGPVDGLTILPAGDAAPESTTSLVELRFHKMLAEIDDRFDAVVVLAPSPDASDDARVMAIGGSLLLVVPARRVRLSVLRRLAGELQSNRVRILGGVLIARKRRSRV